MSGKWTKAVWEAVQRRALDGLVTRTDLINFELDQIVKDVGSVGQTPHQTLSRELQQLRDAGVLIFDGKGNYRIASGLLGQSVDQAIATEAWRYQKTRLGQNSFREKILKYWHGKCPLTGISETELLRASHIIPWNRCEAEEDRLDPDNGILLSPLWDAAFDRGLVTFSDNGDAIFGDQFSKNTLNNMLEPSALRILRFNNKHKENLRWHRENYFENKTNV